MSDKEYLIAMGAKIRAARKAKNLYLRDLGKICNIDYSHIYRMEHGQFASKILTLRTIATALDVDVKDFL